MLSSIFLRTCQRDIRWAEWCLKSIGVHWKTKSQIVVSAEAICQPVIESCQQYVGPIKFCPHEQWEPGWNFQQYTKMTCDEVCDGDVITFIDSDCVFTADCSIEDLLEDGKPIIWYTEYARIPGPMWQGHVERILKTYPEYEFMRRFPITYRRDIFRAVREQLHSLHNMTLETMLKGFSSHIFSEFNIIGTYAFRNEFPKYTWKHTDEIDLHPEKYQWHVPVRQFNWFEWNDDTPDLLAKTIGTSTPRRIKVSKPIEIIEEIAPPKVETNPRLEQTPEGYWVLKDESHLNKWVRAAGRLDHDHGTLDVLCSYIQPGSLVIDVGANIGTHTCRYLQAAGVVAAYEPHPDHFECLRRNCPEALCINKAVSDKCCSTFLSEEPWNTGASFLSEEPHSESWYKVETTTLDHELAAHPDWLPVSYLKIDVEGCEPEVLWGARQLIRRFRPVISLEINNGALKRRGRTSSDIQLFLEENRYKCDFVWGGNWASPQTDVLCRP